MALVKMAEEFGGLPMESLIGGPLQAMIKAQVQASKAYTDFLYGRLQRRGPVRAAARGGPFRRRRLRHPPAAPPLPAPAVTSGAVL